MKGTGIKCGLCGRDRGLLNYVLGRWEVLSLRRSSLIVIWSAHPFQTLSSLNTPPALFNNQPSSILRLSYSSRGVKDVYRCFCFILRSLLQPQYIKHLRRPHCCRLRGKARSSYGPCLRRPQGLSTSGQLLISPLFCNAPTFICNALCMRTFYNTKILPQAKLQATYRNYCT